MTTKEQFESEHPELNWCKDHNIKPVLYWQTYSEWLESRLSPVTDQIGEEVAEKIFKASREMSLHNTLTYESFSDFKSSHPDLFRKTEINHQLLRMNALNDLKPSKDDWFMFDAIFEWLKQQPDHIVEANKMIQQPEAGEKNG